MWEVLGGVLGHASVVALQHFCVAVRLPRVTSLCQSFILNEFNYSLLLEIKCWGEQPLVGALGGHSGIVSVVPVRCSCSLIMGMFKGSVTHLREHC